MANLERATLHPASSCKGIEAPVKRVGADNAEDHRRLRGFKGSGGPIDEIAQLQEIDHLYLIEAKGRRRWIWGARR